MGGLHALTRVNVFAYRASARIHWQPREDAIVRAIERIAARPRLRLVDVGCGLGQLAAVATRLGFGYLGIEPDPVRLAHCRTLGHQAGVRFEAGTARAAAAGLGPDDLLVLNGVAHHLPDDELALAVGAARHAAGLLIADHWRKPGETPLVTRWLQNRDRSRWVRDYDVFAALPGLTLVSSEVLPITLLGFRAWLYFCNLYCPFPAEEAPR
jgi:SAM-dependent methyltransferase